MTNKAYIVVNEQQEREVLDKLEEKGALWGNGEKAVNFIPFRTFPYVIYCNGDKFISWDKLYDLDVDKIIVFDGRKEEQMSEKYVVSQEFMNELVDWRDNNELKTTFISGSDLFHFPNKIVGWLKDTNTLFDNRNRLIAIIRWVNGEDVFEVEKPKKWVVHNYHGYGYVAVKEGYTLITSNWDHVTKFDTKEEAESWANSHQEVVEIESD